MSEAELLFGPAFLAGGLALVANANSFAELSRIPRMLRRPDSTVVKRLVMGAYVLLGLLVIAGAVRVLLESPIEGDEPVAAGLIVRLAVAVAVVILLYVSPQWLMRPYRWWDAQLPEHWRRSPEETARVLRMEGWVLLAVFVIAAIVGLVALIVDS